MLPTLGRGTWADSPSSRDCRKVAPEIDRAARRPTAEAKERGAALAARAGRASTPAKARAARQNAKKGGWPKGRPRKAASKNRARRKAAR